MRGLANPDSKIYALLNKAVQLLELSIYVLLCCLPVITAGAAISSMHAVLLKIYRDEEKRIAGDYFSAMKSNLKNGTFLWLLYWLFLGMLAGLWILVGQRFPAGEVYFLYGLLLAAVLGLLYLDWALILQSRYVYTVGQCLKNALLAWMKHPGSTIVYLISTVIPVLFCFSLEMLPLAVLSVPAAHLISTTLYSQVFDRMEGLPLRIPKL